MYEPSLDHVRCRWTASATEFVRSELSSSESLEFERHLSQCASCRQEVSELRELIAQLAPGSHGEPDLTAHPSVTQSLASSRVLARISKSAWGRRSRSRWPSGSAATAAAWLLVVGAAAVVAWFGTKPGVRDDTLESESGRGVSTTVSTVSVTERSLESARDWLLSVQEADGSWDPHRWGGDPHYHIAVTGLATLALCGDRRAGTREHLDRAGEFLVSRQRDGGHLGEVSRSSLYNHAIGTLALLELMAYEPRATRFLRAADQAVGFLLGRQTSRGAWGYSSDEGTIENESISAWALQAIVRARSLGLRSNEAAIDTGIEWFEKLVAKPKRDRITYHGGDGHICGGSDSPWVAFALFAQRGTAAQFDSRSLIDGLLRSLDQGAEGLCFYDSYFFLEALARAPVSRWKRYSSTTRRALVDLQLRRGPLQGSWDPTDRWSPVGGRLYATALATLALKVP